MKTSSVSAKDNTFRQLNTMPSDDSPKDDEEAGRLRFLVTVVGL